MTGNELRQKYLTFFKQRGHAVVPSASLVPENDPTTLFTSAGMQPMMPYLLGEPHPLGTRIVDSQKCFRSEDIEEVGDNRHTTNFEMLGNWSFGDYFKREQLNWFFEFLTQEVRLDPHKLYVTVFAGNAEIPRDTEAVQIWREIFSSVNIEAKDVENAVEQGMQGGRIFYYPEKKNWWSRSGIPANMPAGEPGGPDSEVFYEFTQIEHDPIFGQHCHPNCDCGRFTEIGNSVFMQYQKQTDGSFKELAQKNIDFGGGLERLLTAANNDPDIFKIDLLYPVIQILEEISGHPYAGEYQKQFRIIADHLRAAVLLASDGVTPSNKAQGYLMRRLIRRSIAAGLSLGLQQDFTAQLVAIVQAIYQAAYPSVTSAPVSPTIAEEEQKFRQTLNSALTELNSALPKLLGEMSGSLTDESIQTIATHAFNFYQSHGLPSDIFLDELHKHLALTHDERQAIQAEFTNLFKAHQELSRTASAGMFKGGLADQSEQVTQYHTATHLLHQALRDVLGEHVLQRGSNITAERLRFDFSHSQRLTPEQIQQVEAIVNQKIHAQLPVYYQTVPLEQAKQSGAIGLFGEKYPDVVKVYSIGQASEGDQPLPRAQVYSREFCGGPHVTNTSEIKGTFKIQKDEKISKDVVRIKAVLQLA